MFVTSASQREGIVVSVITGGRPNLKQRPTRKWLKHLADAGAHVEWVVSDVDAKAYEADGYPLNVYPRDWALEYARDHWMLPTPPPAEGFLGAFPGREWAATTAAHRGYWGVMQLDDNITRLTFARGSRAGRAVITANGSMGIYLDLLAAFTLSTNALVCGAQLSSAAPRDRKIIRSGFPYSLFIERVDVDREHWHGPYEDDITHSFQIGNRPDGAAPAIVPMLAYLKESRSKTGMRAHYNHTRSVQLQRLMPQGATLGIRKATSNGRGDPRVFHKMQRTAIRNQVRVTNPTLFTAAKTRLEQLFEDWNLLERQEARIKVKARAATLRK